MKRVKGLERSPEQFLQTSSGSFLSPNCNFFYELEFRRADMPSGRAHGAGGLPGNALGGGVYNDKVWNRLATISIDPSTVISGNQPDSCFGCP